MLVSQARRCRDILKGLSQAGEKRDERHDRMELIAALEEAAAPLRGLGPRIETRLHPPPGASEADAPMLQRRAELLYGVGNFIENAADFAASRVIVEGGWSDTHLEITIEDDGPGFSDDILAKIGEPYVTTRPGVVGQGGLGLGVFIAKTMIERLGGEVDFSNASEAGGAVVRASAPRARLEVETARSSR